MQRACIVDQTATGEGEDAATCAAMISVAERLLDRIIGIALAARTVEERDETMTPELRYEILGLLCDRAWEIHMALAELEHRNPGHTRSFPEAIAAT